MPYQIRSSDIYLRIIQGEFLGISEIDDLLLRRTIEDQQLEYKSGKLRTKILAREIREVLSSFANSSGGVVMVGIDESQWTVDGFVAPGGIDARQWITDCIRDIAAYFSPRPVLQIINHPQGNILAVAAARSDVLVPESEDNRLTYYFRLHEKTLPAPEYLIGDIVLGRRNRPQVEVVDHWLASLDRRITSSDLEFSFQPSFIIENMSLVWARQTTIGLICWDYSGNASKSTSKQLLSYVSLQKPREPYQEYQLSHFAHTFSGCSPFETHIYGPVAEIVLLLRRFDQWFKFDWHAAVYVVSENTPPLWYQMQLRVNSGLPRRLSEEDASQIRWKHDGVDLFFLPIRDERPLVAING